MAVGAADGAVDPDHPGDDVRDDERLGIDLQQVSIASLIIALGLLVDDPVVAGDAIKRELAAGHPPVVAAWLGPTKLATAILYATITNIVAYLPFLMLPGDTGVFLYSLPVVIACSLVASRIVSMTFIPLLGYYLLRPKARRRSPSAAQERLRGVLLPRRQPGDRSRTAGRSARRLGIALRPAGSRAALKTQFFPKDLSYLSYVDVWLPEDAPLDATTRAVASSRWKPSSSTWRRRQEGARRRQPARAEVADDVRRRRRPRFWFSVAPEQSQPNYAQVLIEVIDKHDTNRLVEPLQPALDAAVRERHRRAAARAHQRWACRSRSASGEDLGDAPPAGRARSKHLRAIPTPPACATTGARRASRCG